MPDYLENTGSGQDAELSGTYTVQLANHALTLGVSGQADTRFTLPTDVEWLLIEVFDVEDVEGDLGLTMWTDKVSDIASTMAAVQAEIENDNAITKYKIVATHYSPILSIGTNIYRGENLGTKIDIKLADRRVVFIFPTSTWKITNTVMATESEFFKLYTLENPNAYSTATSDHFGQSVAITDAYNIVGAPYEDDAEGTSSGKAYIFDNINGRLLHVLDNPNVYGTSASDYFGGLVGISPSYCIVGAGGEDLGGLQSGSAYVFENETGNLLHELVNPNPSGGVSYDFFSTVAICESYSLVGARLENGSSGMAYIFSNTTGSLVHSLNNPDVYPASTYDRFGEAVAITNKYSLIGVVREGVSDGDFSGAAYLFDNSTGNLLHTWVNPNAHGESIGDNFGDRVAVCESYSVVGAPDETDENMYSGKAYIFENSTGNLLHVLDNPNAYGTSEEDFFSRGAVSISEDYCIVGSFAEDDTGKEMSGKAYVFSVLTGELAWIIDSPTPGASDFFALAVGISSRYCIVGSNNDDTGGTDSGMAYTYRLPIKKVAPFSLMHVVDNPNPSGTGEHDWFGIGVAISEEYFVVGSPYEEEVDGSGYDSGKAYVYKNSTGALVMTIDNPNSYHVSSGDHFGGKLAISKSYILVSADAEDASGATNSGTAYLFDRASGNLLHILANPHPGGYVYYGGNVSMSESYSLIISTCTNCNRAYLFENSTGNYLHRLTVPKASCGDVTESYSIIGNKSAYKDGYSSSGEAYVFDNLTGELIRTLVNPNAYGTPASDWFGVDVAICESYSLVGAKHEDSPGESSSGRAYIFDNLTGDLLWTLENPSGEGGESFGEFVSITESYSLVSAQYYPGSSYMAGRAYIFSNLTGKLLHTINNPNAYGGDAQDSFGMYAVAIAENYSIVGAFYEDDAAGRDSGKAYVFSGLSVLPPYYPYRTLDNPNTHTDGSGDRFGNSVNICEKYSIVGAPYEDSESASDAGKAYIFKNSNGELIHTLSVPGTNLFGSSVSIVNEYCVVGTYSSEAAYLFSAETGDLLWTLSGEASGDWFGWSVDICDSYSIVGALYNDATGSDSGRAYVYENSTGNKLWTLENPSGYGTTADDYFGSSVAISESFSIVGATGEDETEGEYAGKAYIFDNTTGSLIWTLDNPHGSAGATGGSFGNSVDISEDHCIVGAKSEKNDGGNISGKAYVFDNLTGELLATLNNPDVHEGTYDDFGISVSISGEYCIVGAYGEDDDSGGDSGVAHIFNALTGELLHTLININAYDVGAYDYFAESVSMHDNYCIVGAKFEDDSAEYDSGKAYLYISPHTQKP